MWTEASGAGGAGFDIDDLFADLFGGGMGATGRARRRRPGWGTIAGADQEAEVTVSVDEAYHGGRRAITLSGTGGSRTLSVTIPPGVRDGQRIRLAGQGGQGTGGGAAGDLYLVVRIAPHPRYRLEGRDIHVGLPVAPWEAAIAWFGADATPPRTIIGRVDAAQPLRVANAGPTPPTALQHMSGADERGRDGPKPSDKGKPVVRRGRNVTGPTAGRPDYQTTRSTTKMNLTKRAKMMVGAAALVGALGAGGVAFTSTGVTNNAGASQFVGGTVSQTVSGATLSSIQYSFTDTSNTSINAVLLTFADTNADTKVPTIVFSAAAPQSFTCSAVSASVHTSNCTADGPTQTGAMGIAVTVS